MFIRIFLFFIIINTSIANAACNFISGNYIEELKDPSMVKEIKIDINKKKNYVINYLKILTQKKDNIDKKLKKTFKADIIVKYPFGECLFQGKVRQHGDNKDHIGSKIKNYSQIHRSLAIKLDKGNILNAVRFKLLIPNTRNDLNEILGSLLLKELGFIVPETFHVKARINDTVSKMIFQEDVRKELLERNHRREGPIFEGDESIVWEPHYILDQALSRVTNKNWFLKGPNSREITINSFTMLQQAYLENRQSKEEPNSILLRINKTDRGKLDKFLLSMIIMNGMHGLSPNNRIFYFNSFTQNFEPIYYDGDLLLDQKIIMNDEEIIKVLKGHSSIDRKPIFTNIKNQTQIFNNFKKRTRSHDKDINKFFVNSLNTLKLNEKYLEDLIDRSKKNTNKKRDLKKDFSNYLLSAKNNNLREVIINKIEENKKNYSAFTNDNENLILSYENFAEIISRNKFRGERYVYIPLKNKTNLNFKTIEIKNLGQINYSKNLLIKADSINKKILLKQQNPNDWALFINANLKDWSVTFDGVSEANDQLELKQRFNKYGLTGCLNFYKSTFNNTDINMSKGKCEDGLNIVNSIGSISKININNSYADAVDIDSSKIEINELMVYNAGNDCMDLSSGRYKINISKINKCGDKGISIGEVSNFIGNKITVENSNIGISVKDLSQSTINSYIASSVDICAESMMKKQEFGGAKAKFKFNNCVGNYKKDFNSIIIQNINEL